MTARQKKERPIIFSGPMIRTILDDRKTQTRRVVKPQPTGKYSGITGITTGFLESELRYVWRDDKQEMTAWRRCPYGAPGNRLWVKEALRRTAGYGIAHKIPDNKGYVSFPCPGKAWPWKNKVLSGRFMPRWASRIVLEIIDVKVERLQNITDEDAIAEGIYRHHEQVGWTYTYSGKFEKGGPHYFGKPGYAFKDLWDSLSAKRGYGWDTNPWVWVITFSRRSRT